MHLDYITIKVAGQLVNELKIVSLFYYSWLQLAIVHLRLNFYSKKILTNFVI